MLLHTVIHEILPSLRNDLCGNELKAAPLEERTSSNASFGIKASET